MYVMFVAWGYPNKDHPGHSPFEFDQAKALAAAGHRVVFACVDYRSIRRWRRWGLERLKMDGVDIYAMNIPVGPIPYGMQQDLARPAMRRLYRIIERDCGKPDIVHAHFYFQAAMVGPLCRREHIPLVVTEHSSHVNTETLSDGMKRRLIEAYGYADRLLAVGTALAERIRIHTGFDAVCVPNMVDTDTFRYRPDAARDGDAVRFVSVGNLLPVKGHDLLLEAFARLHSRYPAARLDIVGGGPLVAPLQEQAKRLGVAREVIFHGALPREEINGLFARADAFVLASRRETFGVAYIEAMAAGLPVIATRCGGPEDFVTPETGLLIPAEDEDALEEAMAHMLLHAVAYDGRAISAYANRRFAPSQIAAQLTEQYRSLLSIWQQSGGNG